MVSCRARPLRAGAPDGAPSPKAALPPHSRQTRRRSRCSRKILPPSGSPSPYSISSLLCRHLGQVGTLSSPGGGGGNETIQPFADSGLKHLRRTLFGCAPSQPARV